MILSGFILKHQHEFRVSKMCQVLNVSKNGYYSWLKHKPSKQRLRKAKLTAKIIRIHTESRKVYGSPKITEIFNRTCEAVNHKGNGYDNAYIESFHSIIKRELIFHENYRTLEQTKASILGYIVSFYNCKRIHRANNYLSSITYEKKYYRQRKLTS